MGKEHRLVVLGAPGVGKSALTVRFLTGRFLLRYDPTLEDEYCARTVVDGVAYQIRVLDTAGQDPLFLQSYCSVADVLLVAFSLTDRTSMDAACDILQLARKQTRKLPALLVGTKSDLEFERRISAEEALAAADKLGCVYTETSAAACVNVTHTFHLAVKLSACSSSSSPADEARPQEYNGEGKRRNMQQSAKRAFKTLRRWSSISMRKNSAFLQPPKTDFSTFSETE